MAYTRYKRAYTGGDYWPGFVDAMATMLLVVTFLLSLFMLAQYFVQLESSGKDTALQRLNRQIQQLTQLLALEKGSNKSIQDELATLTASLSDLGSENARLQGMIDLGTKKADQAGAEASKLTSDLEGEKKISSEALAQVEILNQQLLALRRQIGALERALEASEAQDEASKKKIADLGRRLNVALAKKVEELSRFRSDFFGRLRKLLANRKDVRVVGDRFVFQAEVLFPSGSADMNPEGLATLAPLADAIKTLEGKIPGEIEWVLRVDGHTDIRPISTAEFPSNWELSSARALSVVRFLISRGVSPKHLVAAGFGEFQPLDKGATEESLRRNRRIELKLTTR